MVTKVYSIKIIFWEDESHCSVQDRLDQGEKQDEDVVTVMTMKLKMSNNIQRWQLNHMGSKKEKGTL